MPKTHHDQTLPNTMVKGKESKCNVQGMSKQPRQKPPWSGCAGSQSLPVAAALPHSCSFSFATARFLRNSAVWCFEYINTLYLAAKRDIFHCCHHYNTLKTPLKIIIWEIERRRKKIKCSFEGLEMDQKTTSRRLD